MLRRRLVIFLLILAMFAGMLSITAATIPPYAIKVNRAMNTVTIYAPGDDGYYSVPVKAMICSTAREGHVTPLGRFTMIDWRTEWRLMFDGTYGQYATGFYGNYLFHSICYTAPEHNAMKQESYNALGEPASMGCVRLETEDAKWIYDNCPAGTQVVIYDDPTSPGPLGKPAKTVEYITDEMHNGWDPSDPASGNPWHGEDQSFVTVEMAQQLSMKAGEVVLMQASVMPPQSPVEWISSNEKVARVDSYGAVLALSAGVAVISLKNEKGEGSECIVTVTDELLPFDDVSLGVWYYDELRQAVADGLFQGTGDRAFTPDGEMTRAMVVQVLYNLAGQPEIAHDLTTSTAYMEGKDPSGDTAQQGDCFEDVPKDAWYHDAVLWAAREGVVNGISETEFAPLRPITRQELVTLLWRRAGQPAAETDLSAFADAQTIEDYARDAYAWAVEQGFVWATEGSLQPEKISPRAETAVIFGRAYRAGVLENREGEQNGYSEGN